MDKLKLMKTANEIRKGIAFSGRNFHVSLF